MERFGYDDASQARDIVAGKLREVGLDADNVKDGIVLGSGLGTFTRNHMNAAQSGSFTGAVVVPFREVFKALGIPTRSDGVQSHAHELVIGPLNGTAEDRLVIAQSGREHPYEGVDMKRSVFWVRVMQLLGVETLLGSNAVGIVTPRTLNVPSLMLVNSDLDLAGDNPLVGPNDERFGPRFPHMGDHYPKATRDLVKAVAARLGMPLKEGMLLRTKGPNYESPETILHLRALLKSIWDEAREQTGESRFPYPPSGDPVGVVGMSSTFEHTVAQHASQSTTNPAFQRGRAHISVATNLAAAMDKDGFVAPPSHGEVQENARIVEEQFGALVREVILEMRKAAS